MHWVGVSAVLVVPVVLVLVVLVAVVVLRRRQGEGALPTAVVLRQVGFGIVVVWTLLGGAFIAGDTVGDPGGLRALGWIAAWLVPLAVLAVLAKAAPDLTVRVLAVGVGGMAALALWYAAAPDAWRDFEDDKGPVRAIAMFVLASALGVLGLWRTRAAGVLMLVLGLVPPFLAQLGTSRGMPSMVAAATMPVVVGALYVVSTLLGRRQPVGYGPR